MDHTQNAPRASQVARSLGRPSPPLDTAQHVERPVVTHEFDARHFARVPHLGQVPDPRGGVCRRRAQDVGVREARGRDPMRVSEQFDGDRRCLDSSQLILHAASDPSANAATSGMPHGPNHTPTAPRRTRLEELAFARHSRVYAPSITPVRESKSRTPPPSDAIATKFPPGDVATETTGDEAPSTAHPERTKRGASRLVPPREVRELTFWSRRGTGAEGRSRGVDVVVLGAGRAFSAVLPLRQSYCGAEPLVATVALSSARASSNAFLSLWNESASPPLSGCASFARCRNAALRSSGAIFSLDLA